MGEIADGILNGDFDEYDGEYLGEGDGYPRTCGVISCAWVDISNY